MSRKKTEYTPIVRLRHGAGHGFHKVAKTYLCDMKNANACQKRAAWYGIETIGPRHYALYRCPAHGIFRHRIDPL